MAPAQRLILYHKHASSGRTMFLRLHETVCQFEGLSGAARIVESHIGGNQVDTDLSDLLAEAEHRLGLVNGTLKLDVEFSVAIAEADQPIQVYLAQFTTTDPPEEHFAAQAGKFIALTDARRLPPIELELLRLAYTVIMDDLSS